MAMRLPQSSEIRKGQALCQLFIGAASGTLAGLFRDYAKWTGHFFQIQEV
jgi:hypothetical protein